MKIRILGSGCAKCHRLEQLTREVAAGLGLDAEFDHVTDMQAIMAYPIMTTPALVIDEEVLVYGRMPSKDELAGWLKAARQGIRGDAARTNDA
ncbi:MAG: TM0996/MTH895 family glutaredoxin-like protein [Rhodocyclales bacterium]|nr:TM0996/MTH895 family glutaredoxin-like protein [Rhodocyclales bacterium]